MFRKPADGLQQLRVWELDLFLFPPIQGQAGAEVSKGCKHKTLSKSGKCKVQWLADKLERSSGAENRTG